MTVKLDLWLAPQGGSDRCWLCLEKHDWPAGWIIHLAEKPVANVCDLCANEFAPALLLERKRKQDADKGPQQIGAFVKRVEANQKVLERPLSEYWSRIGTALYIAPDGSLTVQSDIPREQVAFSNLDDEIPF